MKRIPVCRGTAGNVVKEVMVDDDLYPLLSRITWYQASDKRPNEPPRFILRVGRKQYTIAINRFVALLRRLPDYKRRTMLTRDGLIALPGMLKCIPRTVYLDRNPLNCQSSNIIVPVNVDPSDNAQVSYPEVSPVAFSQSDTVDPASVPLTDALLNIMGKSQIDAKEAEIQRELQSLGLPVDPSPKDILNQTYNQSEKEGQ